MISTTYSHTQEAPLWMILFGSSIPCFVLAWIAREQPVVLAVMIVAAVLVVLVGLAFHHLSVEDEGDRLAIALDLSLSWKPPFGTTTSNTWRWVAQRSWMAGESIEDQGTAGSGTSGAGIAS